MEKKDTKKCKKCKEDIAKDAKKCPHCGSKQGVPIWAIAIIVIVIITIVVSSGGSDTDSEGSNTNSNSTSTTKKEPITYTKVTIDQLNDALSNNAATAKDTYENKYLEVSGKIGTIDSDLKYISVVSSTDEWDIVGMHCTIKNDTQRNAVRQLSKDQNIIVKGKITSVGEVLGYYMDLTEVIPN